MADATPNWPRGDLDPPLRLTIEDQGGLRDLTLADSVTLYAKSGSTVFSGTIDPIDPPIEDARDPTRRYNAQFVWQAGNTDVPGTYRAQAEVVTGGKPTTFPSGENGQVAYFIFNVVPREVSAADLP